ncbi:cyclophilin-like domain-containing protein [Clohesyomyces aquaticus]|uniref:Peptidyl-prolyl cis-trans isomerase n=1 Tax=Clohesyomyces aquaticus TaxID=1231657 RepID=A0A1Y1XVB1_9PLEO|nr:cyclophilin-like domain-containing protein [Clohesyomyces aquaticus]
MREIGVHPGAGVRPNTSQPYTGQDAGRIQIELFLDVVPATADNFKVADTKEAHSIAWYIPGFMIQGGDFLNGGGTGGISIFNSESFDDENFDIKHTRPGLLSMANSGPNTNGSQFFILCAATPHLDNKHVVFGEVLEGISAVKKMENTRTGAGDTPARACRIKACGQLTGAKVT